MNVTAPARLGIFAGALAASLGVGLAVGAAAGPVDDDDAPAPHEVEHQVTTPTAPGSTIASTSDDAPTTTTPAAAAPTTLPTSTTVVDHSQMDHPTGTTVTP